MCYSQPGRAGCTAAVARLTECVLLLCHSAAKSNGCRIEGKIDSDGIDVNGEFWSIRNLVKLVLFICCCPCICAAVLYATGANLVILDKLDDCQDALMVRSCQNPDPSN